MNSWSLLFQKIFGHGLQLLFGILLYKLHKGVFVEYSELTLANQYLSYLYLGLPYAVNFYLSTEKEKFNKSDLINNASSLVLILSLLPVLISLIFNLIYLNADLLKSLLISSSIVSLNISIYVYNIWRSTDNIYKVNYSTIFLFGTLLITSIITNDYLIYLTIISLHGIFIFLINYFSYSKMSLEFKYFKLLIKKGFALLIYNVSYYLFIQSLRTIIRIRADDDIFADISLGQTLSNSVFLLLGTLSWIFYSKILKFFSSGYKEHRINKFINDISIKYYSSVELIVYFSITLLISINYFDLISENLAFIMFVLLLSNLSLHSIFPIGEYLVAINKQNILTKISLISLSFFLLFSILVEVQLIILIFYISTELYTFLLSFFSKKISINYLKRLGLRLLIMILVYTKMFFIIPIILMIRVPFIIRHIKLGYKFVSNLKIR